MKMNQFSPVPAFALAAVTDVANVSRLLPRLVDDGAEKRISNKRTIQRYLQTRDECLTSIDTNYIREALREAGVAFSQTFQLRNEIRRDNTDTSIASIGFEAAGKINCLFFHLAVLDATIHLTPVQGSNKLRETGETIVLHELHDMWISATAWAKTLAVNVITIANRPKDSNGAQATSSLLDEATLTPLCVMGSVSLIPVARVGSNNEGRTKLLYGIE